MFKRFKSFFAPVAAVAVIALSGSFAMADPATVSITEVIDTDAMLTTVGGAAALLLAGVFAFGIGFVLARKAYRWIIKAAG